MLSQKKKSYSLNDWPITVSLDTHTPFHHCLLYWGEEMMYWWTEQHEQNRLYTHKLSQHARADRQSCTQRWELALSTIDRDVINVLTEFLFRIPLLALISSLSFEHLTDHHPLLLVQCVRIINDDVTQYNKIKVVKQVQAISFKHESIILDGCKHNQWPDSICVSFR